MDVGRFLKLAQDNIKKYVLLELTFLHFYINTMKKTQILTGILLDTRRERKR